MPYLSNSGEIDSVLLIAHWGILLLKADLLKQSDPWRRHEVHGCNLQAATRKADLGICGSFGIQMQKSNKYLYIHTHINILNGKFVSLFLKYKTMLCVINKLYRVNTLIKA